MVNIAFLKWMYFKIYVDIRAPVFWALFRTVRDIVVGTTGATGAWAPLTFEAEGWAPLKSYKWIEHVVSLLGTDQYRSRRKIESFSTPVWSMTNNVWIYICGLFSWYFCKTRGKCEPRMQKEIIELKKFVGEYTPTFGARLRASLTLIIFQRPW